MMDQPVLLHATAIVVATTGLLFIGPSGTGKSSTAHACLAGAERRGLLARLIADDQVFLTLRNGRILARAPATIFGEMEFRGTGIAPVPALAAAEMRYVVKPGPLAEIERLPPDDARFPLVHGASLPLLSIARETDDPLAALGRFIPFLGLSA